MTEQDSIISEPFTTTSGQYFGTLLTLWVVRYWWLPFVPVALFASLGALLDDWRYMLVALMLVFIVIPMGMTFIYTYYLLTPEARRAIRPKRVEITPGAGLTLIYEPDDDDSEPEREHIGPEMIKEVKITSSDIIILLRTDRLQFLLIPLAAFAATSLPSVIQTLREVIGSVSPS